MKMLKPQILLTAMLYIKQKYTLIDQIKRILSHSHRNNNNPSMDCLFRPVIAAFGPDAAACASWFIASMIWVFGFLYVNDHHIDTFSSNLTRACGLLLLNSFTTATTPSSQISPSSNKNMIIRHLLLASYGVIFAQIQFFLPLGIIHTVYSAGPIFTLLMDIFFSRISASPRQLSGVGWAFLGVVLTINGHFLYKVIDKGYQFESSFEYDSVEPLHQIVAGLVLVVAAIGWAYSIHIAKYIKRANHFQLNFQYGAVMMMFAGCLFPYTSEPARERVSNFWGALLWHGLPLACGQAFFAYSLTITRKAGITSMMGFPGVIMSYIVGIVKYGEHLNMICLSGTGLVIWGVYKIVIKPPEALETLPIQQKAQR